MKTDLLNGFKYAVIAAAVILVSCSGMQVSAADKLTNREITNAVDDELMEDVAVPSYMVDVSTVEGVVTLKGAVKNILAKDRAEKIASTVKGVRGIVNRITVDAPFRTDTEISEDVEDAFIANAVTESWEIGHSVDGGIVNLTGTVDSWQEKELAGKVAKGVKGVKGIDNDIIVDYKTVRTDTEIKEDVESALRWDTYIDDALINVSVDNGNVTLEGTVGSLAEKNRAFNKSWITGVDSVDKSDLEVKWWARDERLREDKYVVKTDKELKEAVNDVFLYDPRVFSFKIDVEPDNGYVTLRGTVDNLKAKRAAAQDARSVVGVWSIDNKIKVRPNTPSDKRIRENIENALLRDPYVELYEIDVTVVDGKVYLYGDVDSIFEKSHADDVASRQSGVRDVNNFLSVNDPDAAVYDPYTDEWYLYDYDWYYVPDIDTVKTDWEIEEDVEDELFWSPFVDSDEVTVEVDDGIATLTGTVDTWSEREAAAENAFEGGAVAVDNDLQVSYGPDYYSP